MLGAVLAIQSRKSEACMQCLNIGWYHGNFRPCEKMSFRWAFLLSKNNITFLTGGTDEYFRRVRVAWSNQSANR